MSDEQKTATTPEQFEWFEELGQLVSCEGEDACYLSDDALDVIRRIQNATLERAAKVCEKDYRSQGPDNAKQIRSLKEPS